MKENYEIGIDPISEESESKGSDNEDLRKAIEEVIMNSKIPDRDREIRIYLGPKQLEAFEKAFKAHIADDRSNNTESRD